MAESAIDDNGDDCCSLVTARADGARGTQLPLVVALHARGGDAASELERARLRFGAGPDIVALGAARPCNPMQSNLRSVAAYAGFSWYLGDDPARPEAASFGDALAQTEAFVRGIRRPFVLAGDEQGAVLSTVLSLFTPHGLVGLHTVRLSSPSIDGWTPPFARMDGIRVVMEDSGDTSRIGIELEQRGAIVDRNRHGAAELERWLESISAGEDARV